MSPFPKGTGKPLNPIRGRDRGLQLFPVNQEFPVGTGHKPVSITSLPLVHTARRYYRLDGLVSHSDCGYGSGNRALLQEVSQTLSSRGSKSRNKVSVGEPAEGSLKVSFGLVLR